MKVKLNSEKGTKREDTSFVIERPTVSRDKMRLGDVEGELVSIEEQTVHLATRKVELEAIKKEMVKLLK